MYHNVTFLMLSILIYTNLFRSAPSNIAIYAIKSIKIVLWKKLHCENINKETKYTVSIIISIRYVLLSVRNIFSEIFLLFSRTTCNTSNNNI